MNRLLLARRFLSHGSIMSPRRMVSNVCTFLPGAVVLALVFVLCQMASDERVAGWLAEYRPVALPLYFLAVVASIVVSPFGGPISLMAVGVQVLGFAWAFPAYLVARTIGTGGAYWIGLTYGERIIRRLTGERGLELVRKLTRVVDGTTLVSLRLFDGNLSDYVSYASGLQRIPWRSYLWKTNLLPLPFLACLGFMLRETRGDVGALTIAIVSTTVLSIVVTAIVYRTYGMGTKASDSGARFDVAGARVRSDERSG